MNQGLILQINGNGWHNYLAFFAKASAMNREEDNNRSEKDQKKIQPDRNTREVSGWDKEDLHHKGPLDKIEGSMNNGEIGGGIKKEEDQ